MIFTPDIEKLIKLGYLKWKSPKEIATTITVILEVPLKPIDVHNYIQGKHRDWANLQPFCAKCNDQIKYHARCPFCTRLLHKPERCCGVDHF